MISLASVFSDLHQQSVYREPAAQVLMTTNAQWTRASVSAPPNGAARGSFGLRGVKLPHRKEKALRDAFVFLIKITMTALWTVSFSSKQWQEDERQG